MSSGLALLVQINETDRINILKELMLSFSEEVQFILSCHLCKVVLSTDICNYCIMLPYQSISNHYAWYTQYHRIYQRTNGEEDMLYSTVVLHPDLSKWLLLSDLGCCF